MQPSYRSRRRPFGGVLLALLLSVAPFTAGRTGNIQLPDIGASSDSVLTPAAEQRLGQEFMRSVRAALPIVDDPLLVEYIQSLGQRLAQQSDAPERAFNFFIIDQPVVNAFAGPGGYIGVYSGLILATESESELASVIAHEIAHVTQEHLMRAFDDASRMSLPTAALMLAAVILGASVDGNLGMAAMAGVQAGSIQHQINFTRHNEEEADREGIKTLYNAGFDPRAMPVFFDRLANVNRLYESNAPEFLRTHPVTTNRIADAMGRAETYSYRQYVDDIRYDLARVTLRVRSLKNPEAAEDAFRRTLAEGRYRNEDAERYGLVLALIGTRKFALAREQLDRLLKKSPDQLAYVIASARLEQAADHLPKALHELETAVTLYPNSYPLNLTYAEILLQNGQAKQAKTVLERLLDLHPADTRIIRSLADAAGKSGNLAEAHYHMAENYYLNGQLEPAIQQLEIAQRREDVDFYLASKIDARLRDYQQQLQEAKSQQARR